MPSQATSRTVLDALGQIRGKQQLLKTLSTLQEATDQAQEHVSWSCGPTGLPEFDQLWPEASLRGGRLVEWRASHGMGAGTFGLLSAGHVLRTRPAGSLVMIDPPRSCSRRSAGALTTIHISPALAWGLDVARILFLKPATPADALWAWEQALRSPGAAACLGWLEDDSPIVLRRLRRAAEIGDTVALLLRSNRTRTANGFADVAWQVQTMTGQDRAPPQYRRRFRVELLKCRGRISGGVADVELTHEATRLPVVSAVARATPSSTERSVPQRSARAV